MCQAPFLPLEDDLDPLIFGRWRLSTFAAAVDECATTAVD
jgi:hypothetical protein